MVKIMNYYERMNYENIPNELKAMPQWVCHRLNWNAELQKYNKIIISPITGQFASCNNPDTWTDFETAKKYCQENKFSLNLPKTQNHPY